MVSLHHQKSQNTLPAFVAGSWISGQVTQIHYSSFPSWTWPKCVPDHHASQSHLSSSLITFVVESCLNRSAKIPFARKRGSKMTSEASSGGESKYTHSPPQWQQSKGTLHKRFVTELRKKDLDFKHWNVTFDFLALLYLCQILRNSHIALGHPLTHVRVTQSCLDDGFLHFVNVFKWWWTTHLKILQWGNQQATHSLASSFTCSTRSRLSSGWTEGWSRKVPTTITE